jgi:hypothetical protein
MESAPPQGQFLQKVPARAGQWPKLMGLIRRRLAYLANDNRVKGAPRAAKQKPAMSDASRHQREAELADAFRRADEEDAKCPP